MKKILTAAVLSSLCLASAGAQTLSFSDSLAQIERIAIPTLDELLATLRQSTDRKVQLETLDKISYFRECGCLGLFARA